MTEAPLAVDNPFWRFSCGVYAAPGVQEACLALQDAFGLDVNLALLCAWLGACRDAEPGEEEIAAAEAEVSAWRGAVVRPLRTVRRRIKAMPALADPAVAGLRGRVAALELEAERIQQAILFRWADPRWPRRGAAEAGGGRAAANLGALLARHGAREAPAAAHAAAVLAEAAERHLATLSDR